MCKVKVQLAALSQFFRWLVTPSGGPYPEPHSLFTVVMEAPIFAHPLGGLFIGALFYVLVVLGLQGPVWVAYALAVLEMGRWQMGNVERLNWHVYGFREVLPRMALGMLPATLMFLL
jgi:hypothetical protein